MEALEWTAMRQRLSKFAIAALSGLLTQPASADSWAALTDVAARIEYGFHAEQPAVIEAARSTLERAGSRDAAADYYRALAALRLAALQPPKSPGARAQLVECSRFEPAADLRGRMAAEAWVLSAACAFAAARAEPLRGLLLQRRGAMALDKAAAIDAANPRLALIRAETIVASIGGLGPEAVAALEDAVAAFELRQHEPGPRWGEVEALARLAEARHAAGDLRAARDLVERALYLAPDYRFARELRDRIASRS